MICTTRFSDLDHQSSLIIFIFFENLKREELQGVPFHKGSVFQIPIHAFLGHQCLACPKAIEVSHSNITIRR